jgi:hypothetical protein
LGAGDAMLECVAKAIHPVVFFVPRILFRFISGAQYIICVADKMANKKKKEKNKK